MMSWVGCLLTDSEIFILIVENSPILLKNSVIPILSTFMYLLALNNFAAHNCDNDAT